MGGAFAGEGHDDGELTIATVYDLVLAEIGAGDGMGGVFVGGGDVTGESCLIVGDHVIGAGQFVGTAGDDLVGCAVDFGNGDAVAIVRIERADLERNDVREVGRGVLSLSLGGA